MRHRITVTLLRAGWVFTFLSLVFTPLVISTRAGGRGDLTIELSLTAGLLAFSLLVSAAVLPSRIRSLTTAFGIERVLRSHRWLALVTLALVLGHLGLVILDKPANIALLDVRNAPPRARAAGGGRQHRYDPGCVDPSSVDPDGARPGSLDPSGAHPASVDPSSVDAGSADPGSVDPDGGADRNRRPDRKADRGRRSPRCEHPDRNPDQRPLSRS